MSILEAGLAQPVVPLVADILSARSSMRLLIGRRMSSTMMPIVEEAIRRIIRMLRGTMHILRHHLEGNESMHDHLLSYQLLILLPSSIASSAEERVWQLHKQHTF